MKRIPAFAVCLLLLFALGCSEFALEAAEAPSQAAGNSDRGNSVSVRDPHRVTIPVEGGHTGAQSTVPESSSAASASSQAAAREQQASAEQQAPTEQGGQSGLALDESLLAVIGMTNGELKRHNGDNCLAEIGQGGSVTLRYVDYYSAGAEYPYNLQMMGDEAAMWNAMDAAGVTDFTSVGNVLPDDFIVLGVTLAPDELFGNPGERWTYEQMCDFFGQWPELFDVVNHEGDWYTIADYTYTAGGREYSLMFSFYENSKGYIAFGVYITDYSLLPG